MVINKFSLIRFFSFIFNSMRISSDSILLSSTINQGIIDQNRAYINLLNAYFALKRQSIDHFIFYDYTPEFVSITRAKIGAENVSQIPDFVVKRIMKIVTAKRDLMQSDLEKVRLKVLKSTQEYFCRVLNANSALTSLLDSATTLDKKGKTAFNSFFKKLF